MPCPGYRRTGTIVFARAVRISKTYGADVVQVMSQNPYRVTCDIRGMGLTARHC
jgi:hypothetical protein